MTTPPTPLHALIRTVPLADIIQDPSLQVRRELSAETVSRYAEAMKAGSEFPPVKLALIEGALYLLDGWHRVTALRRLGALEVSADVFTMGWDEARWYAASANLTNGLPLKRSELRNVFRAYVRAKRHRKGPHRFKSYREMAKELGFAPHTTLRAWMLKDFPAVARQIGGDEGGNAGAVPPMRNPEQQRMASIRHGMEQVAAHFYALKDDTRRGEAIAGLEQVLQQMKAKPYRVIQLDELSAF